MRRVVWIMILAALPFLVVVSLAVAKVFYQWKDQQGVVHLTDDLTKVPEEYRKHVLEIDLSEEEPRPKELPSHPRAGEEPTIIPEEKVDFQGHDRAWWQERLSQWKERKAKAEEQMADAIRRLGKNRLSPPTLGRRQKEAEIREEITVFEEQVQQAERMLKDQLPEEARRAGAPPGWLRE